MNYTKAEAKSWARQHMVGHWTTMVTPFTADGALDEAGLRKNIRYVLQLGTEGLGFTWSFGEFWALTLEERKRVAEIAVEEAKGKALTCIHTTDSCVANCLELTRHAEAIGADIVTLIGPTVAKSDALVHQFFQYIADRVNIGIAIYNNPVIAGHLITPPGIAKLGEIPNVIATKEAYPEIHRILDVFKLAGERIVVSTPHDELYFYEPFLGVRQQCVFASENDWMCDTPERHPRRDFLRLALKGDTLAAARIYNEQVKPIKEVRNKWFRLFQRQGIFPVHFGKYWGELMGMAGGPVRIPSLTLTAGEQQTLREDLQKVGLVKR